MVLCLLCCYACLETFISEMFLLRVLIQTELTGERTWLVDVLEVSTTAYPLCVPWNKAARPATLVCLNMKGLLGLHTSSNNKKKKNRLKPVLSQFCSLSWWVWTCMTSTEHKKKVFIIIPKLLFSIKWKHIVTYNMLSFTIHYNPICGEFPASTD